MILYRIFICDVILFVMCIYIQVILQLYAAAEESGKELPAGKIPQFQQQMLFGVAATGIIPAIKQFILCRIGNGTKGGLLPPVVVVTGGHEGIIDFKIVHAAVFVYPWPVYLADLQCHIFCVAVILIHGLIRTLQHPPGIKHTTFIIAVTMGGVTIQCRAGVKGVVILLLIVPGLEVLSRAGSPAAGPVVLYQGTVPTQ
jgi:hypothetical protein